MRNQSHLLCCFFGVLALIVAPGTLAAEPDSDVAPVRARRRLTQTSVEYSQRAKLTADDGAASDMFGPSISIDGDTIVIGAVHDDDKGTDSGSAYVFTRDTPGDLASNWTQVAKLTADDGAANDNFGGSVSIDGDTIVIGARGDDDKAALSGSAYVFTRDVAGDLASDWTQVAKLNASDGAQEDYLGESLSIDGDTIVIGARYDDGSGSAYNSGAAYVFTRDTADDLSSGWTQVAKLTADDAAANDNFGGVSIDGDTVVIGANGDDDKGSNSGSAYVFTRDTAGNLSSGWTQVVKLTASDGEADDFFGGFGASVSIDGDTVVIGALGDDDKGSNSGSAYVFTRDTAGVLSSGWTQVVKLNASDGAASDSFGGSVSINGDAIVIGARADPGSGSAYVFTRDVAGDLASNWTQVAKLTADDESLHDQFGCSVSIDGDTIAIGSRFDENIGAINSGSAYVFSKYVPPCDASSPPANGAVGNCTSGLASGFTCQPTCDQGFAVSGPSVCRDGVLSPAICVPFCDASSPPANGAVGNCTDLLLNGTACQPTCDEGYIVSGKTSCDAAGMLTAADCRELSCCERRFATFGFGVAY